MTGTAAAMAETALWTRRVPRQTGGNDSGDFGGQAAPVAIPHLQ